MKETKTTVFGNGMIWFGAAISIAEILTGTLVAPLGFGLGFAAIVLGHSIGCALFFLAGLIGAKTGKSAMETVKISFGQKGSLLFSSLNVLQLVGWTAVMIYTGSSAARAVADIGGNSLWCILIGALIIVWVLIGLKNLSKINIVALGALFILTIIMSTVVFKGNASFSADGSIHFGAAVELSAAMPLSWLPLISDYTSTSEKPKKTTVVSTIAYGLTSCWMYVIGMGAAIFTGESDVARIMMGAGLGAIALIIVIFSTVTTTFLDVYSAGVSSKSILSKMKETPSAIVVCVVGTLLATFTNTTQFEDFLYLIGSVFAPMVAILITDFFILKKDHSQKKAGIANLIIWVIGFAIYRVFLHIDTPVGNTLPVMIITSLLCILVNKMIGGFKNAETNA